MIASLGDAKIGEEQLPAIAKAVERRLDGQSDWFEEKELFLEGAAWVGRIVQLARRSRGGNRPVKTQSIDGVLVNAVQTQDVVELGPELVAMKASSSFGIFT